MDECGRDVCSGTNRPCACMGTMLACPVARAGLCRRAARICGNFLACLSVLTESAWLGSFWDWAGENLLSRARFWQDRADNAETGRTVCRLCNGSKRSAL